MNFPLSEIITWILEPLAGTIKESSEVISGEDLRSRMDGVNAKIRDWSPEPEMEGELADHPGMVESQEPPKLCWCGLGECNLVKLDGGNQDSFKGAGGVCLILRELER